MKVSRLLAGMIGFFVYQMSMAFATNPEIQLQGTVRTNSCGYYSSTVGDFSFAYRNDNLPWGTKIILHYGYQVQTSQMDGEGQSIKLTWQDQRKIEMNPVSDFVWGAYIKESIHYRSKPTAAPQGINFAFEVILPDGTTFWEKGTSSYHGHYTGVWDQSSIRCNDQSSAPVILEDLPISVDIINRYQVSKNNF